jgi:hypothetical protein
LKTGIVRPFYHKTLFINDPKYGIIHESSYGSMEECFSSWNAEDEDEPRGYGCASDLLSLDRQILIDYMNKVLKYVDNSVEAKERFYFVVRDCFGQFYENIDSNKLNDLSNEELVYLILQCDNYWVGGLENRAFSMYDLEVHGIFQNKYRLPCGCHKFYENECDHK